jgi:FlaG/FlaF family flagellin (archaellin)
MMKLFRNKKALSTVVATLILLVVSVLLAGVGSYFAINVAGTRVQQEKLYLSSVSVWYENSNSSLGSIIITNTGATDVILSKVTIKGRDSTWNGTSTYVLYTKKEGIISADLEYVSNFNQTGTNALDIDGTTYNFTVVSENLILQSGWTMLFFIVNPGNLIVYDVVTPIRVMIVTGQALYATETVVKAV